MATDKTYVYYQLGRVNKFAVVNRVYSIDVVKSPVPLPHGGFKMIETPKSKKRRRYFRDYVKKYSEIDAKYDLGLTHEEIRSPAYQAADNKASASMTWYQSIFSGNGLESILMVVMMVIAIVVNVIPGGGQAASVTMFSTIMGYISTALTIAGSIAATGAHFYAKHVGNRVTGLSGIAMSLASASSFRRNASYSQSNSLTNLIVYGGYAIYPNNAIYKQGAASQEDYVNTIAYDPTKGMRGDLPQDKIGEKIHSRYGGDLAGGINHHQNLMELEMPIDSFTFGAGDLLDSSGDKLQHYMKRINKGFAELTEQNFGADEKATQTYQRVKETQTRPIKQYMKQVDFLDKLQNYSKNLMANFNFLHENNFKNMSVNKGTRLSYTYFLEGLNSYFEILDIIADENLYVLKEGSLIVDTSAFYFVKIIFGYIVSFTQEKDGQTENKTLEMNPYFPKGLFKADRVYIKPIINTPKDEDELNNDEDEWRLRIWDLDFLDGHYAPYRENYSNDDFVMPTLPKEKIVEYKKELETLCFENLEYYEISNKGASNSNPSFTRGIVIKNPNKTLYWRNDNNTFTAFSADYFFIGIDEDNFKLYKEPIPEEFLDEDKFNEKMDELEKEQEKNEK